MKHFPFGKYEWNECPRRGDPLRSPENQRCAPTLRRRAEPQTRGRGVTVCARKRTLCTNHTAVHVPTKKRFFARLRMTRVACGVLRGVILRCPLADAEGPLYKRTPRTTPTAGDETIFNRRRDVTVCVRKQTPALPPRLRIFVHPAPISFCRIPTDGRLMNRPYKWSDVSAPPIRLRINARSKSQFARANYITFPVGGKHITMRHA